ncbi:MAG: GNAT family N-acetyltransferase [bacterium]|nr:GNAT family N-acetyltransferase [bacterium]
MSEKVPITFEQKKEDENIPITHGRTPIEKPNINLETVLDLSGSEADLEKVKEARVLQNEKTLARALSKEKEPPISELTPDMWEKWRAVRLQAKKTDAQAFSNSLKMENDETPEAYWREKLANPDVRTFTIEIGGRVVAMAGLGKGADGRFLVLRVYTVPEMRGTGLGKILVEKVCAEAKNSGAKSIELDVAEEQSSARSLYQKLGFEEFDVIQREKGDGKVHNQICMRKMLE